MGFSRANTPVLHFDDINGRPLVGGLLYTYAAGTNTPATTYRDAGGTEVNENPVPLDQRGECEVWLDEEVLYKFVLTDAMGNVIWEQDDISSDRSTISGDGSTVDVSSTIDGGVTKYVITLKAEITQAMSDMAEDIEELYTQLEDKKDRQQAASYEGSATKTVTGLTQDENGNVVPTFGDIEFPEQTSETEITSPQHTLSVTENTSGNIKTFGLDIADGGVFGAKLMNGSVTEEKIADGSVNSDKLDLRDVTFLDVDEDTLTKEVNGGEAVLKAKPRIKALTMETKDSTWTANHTQLTIDDGKAYSLCYSTSNTLELLTDVDDKDVHTILDIYNDTASSTCPSVSIIWEDEAGFNRSISIEFSDYANETHYLLDVTIRSLGFLSIARVYDTPVKRRSNTDAGRLNTELYSNLGLK